MASEADNQLHPAVSKASRMISHPRAVNDILQVFFEMNYDYFLKWRIFRLTSSSSWTCIQRIYEWFREHPDIHLQFRQLVPLFPGVSVPITYSLDELVWIEVVYGGRSDLDAMLLSEASRMLIIVIYSRMSLKISLTPYGVSEFTYAQYSSCSLAR